MSDVNVSVEYELKRDTILKILRDMQDDISVKVGILGEDGSKKADNDEFGSDLTTATLGAIQEYGTFNDNPSSDEDDPIIPARSFIQMPIDTKLVDELLKSKGFRSAIQELNLAKINDEIGMAALGVIDDAFDTGGFGEWTPLSEKTIKRKTKNGKKGNAILIDTGNLRRSITYEVTK